MRIIFSLLSLLACADALHFYKITSWDGTNLSANADVPLLKDRKYPLVIFINSWGIPGFEYILPTLELGNEGFVAVEYEARGWFKSGGVIGTAGPDDIKDVSAVIDDCLKRYPEADPTKITLGGISYGAGISLLGSAHDKRVNCVIAMSGWASIQDALWWQWAPGLVWSEILLQGGKQTGVVPPILPQMLHDVLNFENVSGVVEWTGIRSPRSYLDEINARQVPIFLSNNMEDNLFHANFQLELWTKFTGPKRLMLNQGTHAEAELTGLLGLRNQVWKDAIAWMKHFQKGGDKKITEPPLVTMELGDRQLLTPKHVEFKTWPTNEVETKVFYITEKVGKFGGLSETAPTSGSTDTITMSRDVRMRGGLPIISPVLKPFIPIKADLNKLQNGTEIAFKTAPFEHNTKICGAANITNLWVTPQNATVKEFGARFQLFAYLYKYKQHEDATLMSHSPAGVWNASTDGTPYKFMDLQFRACCVEIEKGESVALGFNSHNLLYESANKDKFSLTFDYVKGAHLSLPFVK